MCYDRIATLLDVYQAFIRNICITHVLREYHMRINCDTHVIQGAHSDTCIRCVLGGGRVIHVGGGKLYVIRNVIHV